MTLPLYVASMIGANRNMYSAESTPPTTVVRLEKLLERRNSAGKIPFRGNPGMWKLVNWHETNGVKWYL